MSQLEVPKFTTYEAEELIRMARSQGVSPETLVNVLLLERIQQMPAISSSKA